MSQVTGNTGSPAKNAWSIGGTVFAATLMVMIGIFQILMGISAISNDSFLVLRGDYVYNVDTTAWGWIHLGLGALVLLTGIALYTGATWAKVAGIILVALAAIDNFLFVPYYPIWSLLLIAMDVFVIWALAYSLRNPSTDDGQLATGGGAVMAGDRGYGNERWATNPSAGYRAGDPEAARRASDMATPAGARHAQTEYQPEMHSAMAGGTGQQGMGQQGMGQQGMGQQQGMNQPGMNQPGMGQPGMGQPGMGQPGQPGMPQSGGAPPSGQPPRTQTPPADTP